MNLRMLARIGLIGLTAVFAYPANPAAAEMLALPNGDTITVSNLTFDGNTAHFNVGTETRTMRREEIRDIGFTGEEQKFAKMATDVADLPALMERAQELRRHFPDSASILVRDEAEFHYRADGTRSYKYRGVLLLVKEESLGNAEMSLGFDPNRERTKIIHARSYGPDGVMTPLPLDQIKVSKGASGGEYFNNIQQISFTIPNAAPGCLIDYCYEQEEFNPFDKKLWQGEFAFQGGEPVADSLVRVCVPKGFDLPFLTRHMPTGSEKPVISEVGDEKIYLWRLSDMPPIISEPYMPPSREIVPIVYFSQQKDWSYMFDRLKPMFDKRFDLTEAVKHKVDELIQGANTIEEKISRIYLFCQKEIRYISIKGNLSSNQVGHAAEETLKNRYGDCTDKGMLLATMLKHIGIEAYPVGILTNPSGQAIRELPIFDSNHCITEVNMDGKRFWLDSTATDYRYPYFRADDHDVLAENSMARRIDHIPVPPPEDNSFHVTRDLILAADGSVKVDFKSECTGHSEANARGSSRNMKPEEYEKQIRASISELTPDYVLQIATHSDPLDFSSAFHARSSYTLNKIAPRSGKYMIFEIPFFRMRFAEVSLAKRTYDIVYTTSSQRIDDITIKLPHGFRVKFIPEPLKIKTPYIDFESKYTQSGNDVKVFRKLSLPVRIVPVKDYEKHKEALERISRFTEERIFLEEINPTAPEGAAK
ncbi:MAG: DUF3857 domain-containing protein [Candidatus Riflebacteria bacterium]|nr:DUF3857 domain-containing protein [Candidatus Riflebacteria bacterium]